MDYNELLRIAAGGDPAGGPADKNIKKLLSPSPLNEPEDLEKIISARFRYTGPGKWMKILRRSDQADITSEK